MIGIRWRTFHLCRYRQAGIQSRPAAPRELARANTESFVDILSVFIGTAPPRLRMDFHSLQHKLGTAGSSAVAGTTVLRHEIVTALIGDARRP